MEGVLPPVSRAAIRGVISRFAASQSGNIAAIFAIACIPSRRFDGCRGGLHARRPDQLRNAGRIGRGHARSVPAPGPAELDRGPDPARRDRLFQRQLPQQRTAGSDADGELHRDRPVGIHERQRQAADRFHGDHGYAECGDRNLLDGDLGPGTAEGRAGARQHGIHGLFRQAARAQDGDT